MVVCLFEQSGTFKTQFIKKGYNAIDIDILNDYKQTDIVANIFEHLINNSMDNIIPNGTKLIIAFFPCTWFSNQNKMIYNKVFKPFRKWNEKQINDYILKRKKERAYATIALLKLVEYCNIKSIPLIIENPRSDYINTILGKPTYYDIDRTKHGDILVKPTYYYCFNCAISELDNISGYSWIDVNHLSKKQRSLISPKYAANFINHIII